MSSFSWARIDALWAQFDWAVGNPPGLPADCGPFDPYAGVPRAWLELFASVLVLAVIR